MAVTGRCPYGYLPDRTRLTGRLPLPFFTAVRDEAIDPANARFAYVHAVALNSAGKPHEAIAVLEASHARHPADRDVLFALVTINRDAGRNDAALAWAGRLAAIDPEARALVDQLR